MFYIYFRWPHLKKVCAEQMREEKLDFEELVKFRTKYSTALKNYLKRLSKRFFDMFDHNHTAYRNMHTCYDCIDHIYIDDHDLDFFIREENGGHPMNYYFLLDELNLLKKPHR